MNPVDEYEAFRVMAEEGKAIADIAVRFATTETIIKRRLALARVSPALLALYREEQMTFDQLSACTSAVPVDIFDRYNLEFGGVLSPPETGKRAKRRWS